MRGNYYIGKNPRTSISVVVSGSELIATSFARVDDPDVYWLNEVRPGDVVDIIGACSFVCGGVDPRQQDGGATLEIRNLT